MNFPIGKVCLHGGSVLKISGKYKFSEVTARHWEQFALDAALSPAQAKKRILDIARRLPDLARATQARFQSLGNSHPIIDQIVTLIDQRYALTIRRLTAQKAGGSSEESS